MDSKDLEIKKLKKELHISSIKQFGFILLLIAEMIILVAFFINFFGLKTPFDNTKSKYKIATLHIDRKITGNYIEELIDSVEKIKDDEKYKALLVKLSSPGGSPSASQEFAQYLRDLNKTLPVYMYVADMAASGAYYIASAIKPIYANKNAIVGSIGVIMPHYNLSELAQKVGIKEDTITAGKFKQPFSFFKEMTDENRRYIEDVLLKPAYKNFLEDVAHNRGISIEKLKPYAEGKVFIASMPQIQGVLVDEITNLYKLKAQLKKRFKKANFVAIEPKKGPKDFFRILFNERLHNLLDKQLQLQ